MNQVLLFTIGGVVFQVFVGLLGWRIGETIRRRRQGKRTLLIGIDKPRGDVELRWALPKGGMLKWGTEKEGGMVHDGVVMPGQGSSFTINGAGRAFFVDRRTLTTMRVGKDSDALEAAPEDGWQVGMYALGIHERNIAKVGGGSWLDTLAGYTPIILLALCIITVGGFAIMSGKINV